MSCHRMKKTYQTPQVKVSLLRPHTILSGSVVTDTLPIVEQPTTTVDARLFTDFDLSPLMAPEVYPE